MSRSGRIDVAFGFHVNCYHSFRNDTPCESGFGKDIRIIRKVLDVLDAANEAGVPVAGTWDFEHLFSLEEILPDHAPDILSRVRRRVDSGRDEILLMSYNNAMASALDTRELKDSVGRAISNPKGSGVADLFSRWAPVVRPQEMMTTPGSFRIYEEAGVRAAALYYSAIPFDAFRCFVRPLTLAEAHNPLTYVDPADSHEFTILPCYNPGDLIENVSLTEWAYRLHRAQQAGEIPGDALIFINFDADDEFWFGYDLPAPLRRLPNTSGLEGLIREIAGLEYVRCTTPWQYLEAHPPVGRISFGQDTADGSFNGYASWAEKAGTPETWTEIMRDRRLHSGYAGLPLVPDHRDLQVHLEQAYELRLRLLSTTHFGLATPFLASDRERELSRLMRNLRDAHRLIESRLRDRYVRAVRSEESGVQEKAGEENDKINGYWCIDVRNRGRSHSVDKNDIGSDDERGGCVVRLELPFPVSDIGNLRLCRTDGSDTGAWNLGGVRADPMGSGGGEYSHVVFSLQENDENTYGEIVLRGETGDTRTEGTRREGRRHDESKTNRDAPPAGGDRSERGVSSAPRRLSALIPERSSISNSHLMVRVGGDRHIEGVWSGLRMSAGPDSFLPCIRYDGRLFGPSAVVAEIRETGPNEPAVLTVSGELKLTPRRTVESGRFEYRLSLVPDSPLLFIEGFIRYPETVRDEVFKPDSPALSRAYDPRWQEVYPCPVEYTDTADPEHPFVVHKHNHLGVESSYRIDYQRHSPANLNLANVNNHITAGYVAVSTRAGGIAMAQDPTIYANFAGVPLRIRRRSGGSEQLCTVNPFGCCHGPQYRPPTWGTRKGYHSAFITGQQYASSAPTYNGYEHRFALAVGFWEGTTTPAEMATLLLAYSHPPLIVPERTATTPPTWNLTDLTRPPAGFIAVSDSRQTRFHWKRPKATPRQFEILIGRSTRTLEPRHQVSGEETSLVVDLSDDAVCLQAGKQYYAAVRPVLMDGTRGERSRMVRFVPGRKISNGGLSIPLSLQLGIACQAVAASIRRRWDIR